MAMTMSESNREALQLAHPMPHSHSVWRRFSSSISTAFGTLFDWMRLANKAADNENSIEMTKVTKSNQVALPPFLLFPFKLPPVSHWNVAVIVTASNRRARWNFDEHLPSHTLRFKGWHRDMYSILSEIMHEKCGQDAHCYTRLRCRFVLAMWKDTTRFKTKRISNHIVTFKGESWHVLNLWLWVAFSDKGSRFGPIRMFIPFEAIVSVIDKAAHIAHQRSGFAAGSATNRLLKIFVTTISTAILFDSQSKSLNRISESALTRIGFVEIVHGILSAEDVKAPLKFSSLWDYIYSFHLTVARHVLHYGNHSHVNWSAENVSLYFQKSLEERLERVMSFPSRFSQPLKWSELDARIASGCGTRQFWNTGKDELEWYQIVYFMLSDAYPSHASARQFWFSCLVPNGYQELNVNQLKVMFEDRLASSEVALAEDCFTRVVESSYQGYDFPHWKMTLASMTEYPAAVSFLILLLTRNQVLSDFCHFRNYFHIPHWFQIWWEGRLKSQSTLAIMETVTEIYMNVLSSIPLNIEIFFGRK